LAVVLRRTVLALLAIALLAAAFAQPAVAAPPPTLTGKHIGGEAFDTGFGDMTVDCTRNADGSQTVVWDFSNTDPRDPYPGTVTERGSMTARGEPGDFGGDIVSLSAEFTINSSVGQVSGTKRLTAPAENAAFWTCGDPEGEVTDTNPLQLAYSATITTSQGVFADRGTATHDFEDQSPLPGASTRLDEHFTSDLASPEQRGSILFGKRTPGASFSAMSANAKRAVAFPLYFPATVKKIHAFIDGKGATSGSQTLRGVLYANGPGNAPGALLARTFQFSVPAGLSGRWLELYLAPAIRLNPGVYWLGLHSGSTNGVARFAWDPRDNSRRFNVDYYPDGPSNPFGSAPLDNQQMSIFASGSF
jgi:hypothetical protein